MAKKLKREIESFQMLLKISFSERLSDSGLWISKAKQLIFAAESLKSKVQDRWSQVKIVDDKIVDNSKEPHIQDVYFMLIAYAIENLFKAILILRKQRELKNRLLSKVPKDVLKHDLLQLAHNVGMFLTIPEQNLFARLSRNSVWAARYPIPTEAVDLKTSEKLLNGQDSFVAYFAPDDIKRIDEFLSRLLNLAEEELSKK